MRRELMLYLALAALVAADATLAGERLADKPQTRCPVTGEPINSGVHLDYEGQRVYFCCPKCPAEFRKEPESYFAKFENEGVRLENVQTTCPVSGEKLGEGDMGKPASVRYKGHNVRFCCRMCVTKFEADPATYLARLTGEPARTR